MGAVDPDVLAEHADTLQMLQKRDIRMDGDGDRVGRLNTTRDMVAALRAHLDAHEQASVDTAGHRTLELAQQHLRTIEDAVAAVRADENDDTEAIMRIRDTAMAENVAWILDHSDHDRIALWTHNEHVRRGTVESDWGEVRTMGDHLAERYGDDYYTIGFDFGRGELQGKVATADADDAPDRELGACEYGDPEPDTLTAAFSQVDDPLFFLAIQSASEDPALEAVLDSDARIRSVGAYVGNESEHWTTIVPADVYDGLIFVQETTRAVPNDRAR